MQKTFRMQISLVRTFGTLVTLIGLCLIIGFGMSASKGIDNTEVSETEIVQESEEHEVQKQPVGLSDNKWLQKSYVLFFGAFMILSGTSCFYVPYTDKTVIIWKRRYEDDEEIEENMKDSEFDYPEDEDFDFILDEEIRQRMIELRDERIKEKRKRQKRFRIGFRIK